MISVMVVVLIIFSVLLSVVYFIAFLNTPCWGGDKCELLMNYG